MGADEKYAGKQVRCKKCNQVTLIPEISQTSETKPEQKDIIKFRCPSCSQKIGVKAQYAGRKVKCAKCRTPLIIPSPGAGKAPTDKKEPTVVPTAGTEKHLEEKSLGDFSSDFNELLEAEQGAPAIELEKPLKLAPEETPASDFPAEETQFIGTQTIETPKKKNTGLYIALGAIAFIVMFGIILYLTMPESPEQKQAKQFDTQEAQKFAEDYIDLLVKNDLEKAISLLSPELQNSSQKINGIAGRVAKGPIREIQPATPYVEYHDNRTLFYFHFDIYYGEKEEQKDEKSGDNELNWEDFQIDWQYLVMVVSKTELEMRIEELAVQNPITSNAVSLGPTSFEKLSDIALTAEMEEFSFLANIFGRFFCGIIIALIILGLLTVISMWIVFDKAGEPGWAAIVPFYNMWVYAKVADQSGWLGLSTYFLGWIPLPYVAEIIGIAIHLVLGVGVAKKFSRGILFGIGLCFLPFIFFPILAFSD
jgi:hypothetical protein